MASKPYVISINGTEAGDVHIALEELAGLVAKTIDVHLAGSEADRIEQDNPVDVTYNGLTATIGEFDALGPDESGPWGITILIVARPLPDSHP